MVKKRYRLDLRTGYPDTQRLVPHEHLGAIMQELIVTDKATQYAGDRLGPIDARDALAQFVTRYSGDTAHPDELMMTSGAIYGIDTACRAMTRPGDVVVVENPTFYYIISILKASNVEVVAAPMTDEGIDLNALRDLIDQYGERLKLVYTIASFHNPTGISATPANRQGLVALAHQHNFTVLDDATYQWLHFDQPAPPLCQHYDEGQGRVITAGSFSKILMPALRQGFLWSTKANAQRFIQFRGDGAPSALLTRAVGEYIRRELIDDQILAARILYAHGRDVLCAALGQHLPDWAQWQRPNGGYFVWVTLPDGLSAEAVLSQAQAHEVDFLPGHFCYATPVDDRYMRLCFTMRTDEELHEAAQILAQCLNTVAARA